MRDWTHEARTIGVVVDGMGWRDDLACALHPLRPSLFSQEPWPAWTGRSSDLRYLRWLGEAFAERPLLGLTCKPLLDEVGINLRGAARLGEGLALVSTLGLSTEAMSGVLIHEVAHALGMDHCELGACALEKRPWPLSPEGRPSALCPECKMKFERLCAECTQ